MSLLDGIKKAIMSHVDLSELRIQRIRRENQRQIKIGPCDYEAAHPIRVGIIQDYADFHRNYIAACHELKIAYRVVDLMSSAWLSNYRQSECDIYVVWPPVMWRYWKDQFDERLRILTECEKAVVYPASSLLWMFESKRRMNYFLSATGCPHPETRVFYQKEEAWDYVRQVELPIVFKMDMGSGARGVRIIRKRKEAFALVKRAFARGVSTWSLGPYEKERGWVIFQEYLSGADEWRVIRIGESYFAYRKARIGDFHSGTKQKIWGLPPMELLEFVREITSKHNLTSVSFDIFETAGAFLINEIQVYFGTSAIHQMKVDGRPCRYRYDAEDSEWKLEFGEFCCNACCNLRLLDMLDSVQSGDLLSANSG